MANFHDDNFNENKRLIDLKNRCVVCDWKKNPSTITKKLQNFVIPKNV